MNPIKIVIIEDEKNIIEIVRLYLEQEGYLVNSAVNGKDGLCLIEKIIPDIVLLDINLPDKSGFELARKFREISDGILIFITGEKAVDQIVKGFEVGCDDYVTKPFDPAELLARMKVHIKRMFGKYDSLQIGELVIDIRNAKVTKRDKELDLSKKESALLIELAKNSNEVISTQELFERVWGIEAESDLKTVSVHIRTLRKKVEDDPNNPRYILTERGFGYRLAYIKEYSGMLEG